MTLALEAPIETLPQLGGMTADLTKRQKAAIVVRLLLAEGAKMSLEDLPEELQSELALQMSEMRFVDRATLAEVVEEFLSEVDRDGLSFPGSLHGTLSMLDGTISAATASRLRKNLNAQLLKDPWERISGIASDRILPILERESVEVAAVILSKLKVSKAAELLSQLPGPRARRISYAISQTGNIGAAMVNKIGLALANELNVEHEAAFNLGPVQRLGEILNSSQSVTRDDVLAGLDEEDADFAGRSAQGDLHLRRHPGPDRLARHSQDRPRGRWRHARHRARRRHRQGRGRGPVHPREHLETSCRDRSRRGRGPRPRQEEGRRRGTGGDRGGDPQDGGRGPDLPDHPGGRRVGDAAACARGRPRPKTAAWLSALLAAPTAR